MKIKYSVQNLQGNYAKAYGLNLSISTKKSVEICNNIRGKNLEMAKQILEKAISKEKPIVMKRYIKDSAHKKGMATGKYPVKAATAILKILKNAESNAQSKGLSTKDMIVYHIAAHKASTPWRYGRQRRRKMKRSHIEVVLLEKKINNSEKKLLKKKQRRKND
ncbi:MAG TPA: 50S ribosomal protein L22 [Candidatus Woesearchaeota archaeon]|nr:50S ribosomal protein L22 [Candidatus Woesearchaeota archaeon]